MLLSTTRLPRSFASALSYLAFLQKNSEYLDNVSNDTTYALGTGVI